MTQTKPLFGFSRSTYYEVVVHGIAVFVDDESGYRGMDGNPHLVMRSLLKPWQFLATGLEAVDSAWALAIASHDGDRQHLEALAKIGHGYDIAIENLHCPETFPMLEERAWELKLAGQVPQKVYHPCSGKHLAMAIASKQRGWAEDYTSFDHPIHKRLTEIVAKSGITCGEWLVDSCGLPTLSAPLENIIEMWKQLCMDQSEAAIAVKELWTKNANLIGGKDRLDSRIIRWGRGRLIAKEGADGLLAVFSLPRPGEPVQGCMIKLTSGYNSRYLGLALWNLLVDMKDDLNQPFRTVLQELEQARTSWIPQDQVLVANPV